MILSIINRKRETVSYWVEVRINEVKSEIKPIELEHDEKWQGTITFTPDKPGENQKVEFL
ncbi:DUF1616 domain-containing protein [Dehalococcoidales bacterium]|nr:DUF1616 domain-containing protein [Dehalococcoidales bacterium]